MKSILRCLALALLLQVPPAKGGPDRIVEISVR